MQCYTHCSCNNKSRRELLLWEHLGRYGGSKASGSLLWSREGDICWDACLPGKGGREQRTPTAVFSEAFLSPLQGGGATEPTDRIWLSFSFSFFLSYFIFLVVLLFHHLLSPIYPLPPSPSHITPHPTVTTVYSKPGHVRFLEGWPPALYASLKMGNPVFPASTRYHTYWLQVTDYIP